MQRKATKNTRGPNADEKRFHAWCKQSNCIVCSALWPSIVHHCEGSTFKHNKVLVGHWFTLPLCGDCDDVVTRKGKPAFRDHAGSSQAILWLELINQYPPVNPPADVIAAITDWGR